MAEMNEAVALIDRRNEPPVDVGGFASEIEKQANILAESGWMPEAVNLRKWASELRGQSLKGDYARI